MTTKIGKLRYDSNNIIGSGSYGTLVFSGFFKRSLFGSDKPVAIKRIQKGNDVNLKEVEIMKKATDNAYILRFIHIEMTKDFLLAQMK